MVYFGHFSFVTAIAPGASEQTDAWHGYFTVLIWELRNNRLSSLLNEVAQWKRREERFDMEEVFFGINTNEDRRRTFCEKVRRDPVLTRVGDLEESACAGSG